MSDWIFDNFGWIISTFLITVFILIFIVQNQECKEYNRLLTECLKDHKEYECVSMLRHNSNRSLPVYVAPVIR